MLRRNSDNQLSLVEIRTNVDLPLIYGMTAEMINKSICSNTQLEQSITYLELVILGEINPGKELEKFLGRECWGTWNHEELEAVRNRLMLALCKRFGKGYQLRRVLGESVFRQRNIVTKVFGRQARIERRTVSWR